jgi:hypothetical protein
VPDAVEPSGQCMQQEGGLRLSGYALLLAN